VHYEESARVKEAHQFPETSSRSIERRWLDSRAGFSAISAVGCAPMAGRPMTFLTRLRFRLEYVVFRLVVAAIRALPLEAVSGWSGAAWRLIAPRLSRQRRVLDNLAAAYPDMSLEERKRVASAMWENLGRTFAEFFHLDEIVASGRIALEPFERFERIAHGGPFVVCGLHLGNWEIMSQAGKRFGVPLTGVYQRLTNPYVDAATFEMRARHYEGGFLPKTPVTARTLLRKAKEGVGCPAFLADTRDDRGSAVPFFGRPALSYVFPALLARTVGLPLYACAVFRLPNVHFSIQIEPVTVPRTNDRDADALAATAALQAQFEAFIRRAPEQWMWGHRRWD
jgi:Kdo2-lipid IVA lauroyltransferase/acyltransferase